MKKLTPILILSLIGCQSVDKGARDAADSAIEQGTRDAVGAIDKAIRGILTRDDPDDGAKDASQDDPKSESSGAAQGGMAKYLCQACGGTEYAESAPVCCGEKMKKGA